MTYVDADSGVMTTKGWWYVEPGGETDITVDADESSDVYYAAYNKNQYFDSSIPGNPNIRRWASPRTFTYATNDEPDDSGVWLGTFYRINGKNVNIDTSVSPRRQSSQNAAYVEPRISSSISDASGEKINTADDAEISETLGNLLSTEYLSQEELTMVSKEVLAYLRNRIYANHGYNFITPKWRDMFSQLDWYEPNPNFSENLFNEYEKENLRRIIAEEKSNTR
jgi:hypothetical protein